MKGERLNLDELQPTPYPSGPRVEAQRRKRDERIAALRALGIDARPLSNFGTGISIGPKDADRIIRALRRNSE